MLHEKRLRGIAVLVTLAVAMLGQTASASTEWRYCDCWEGFSAFDAIRAECEQLDDNPPPYHCGDFAYAGACWVTEDPYEIHYDYYCYQQETICTQWLWEEWEANC